MIMKSVTTNTLEKLEKIEWFGSVGVHDVQTPNILSSWTEAIDSCSSMEWQDLLIEAANEYRKQILKVSKERFTQWNEVIREVKKYTMPMVSKKIEKVVKENSLPKIFEDTVNWDIMHLAMEAEYSDVYKPGFFASQSYWYAKGHFPCGWIGEF